MARLAAIDRRRSFRNERPGRKKLGIWCAAAALLLLLVLANMWRGGSQEAADLPLNALKAAYEQVLPGETAAPELTKLGFDTGKGGVKRLTYLGLMEYFAPRDSNGFDQLDPAAQRCLNSPEGCSAYVFRLARAIGSEHRASFGFVNAAEASNLRNVVEVVFLIHDGRVAYKAMSGV